MSNAKHTPGPWNMDDSREKAEVKIGKEYFYFDNKADARLISAAPEQHDANVKTLDFLLLLKATEAVNEYAAHMVDELDALIEQNASAIAKARGE